MKADYGKGLYREYELLLAKNEAIEAEHKVLQKQHRILMRTLQQSEKLQEEMNKKIEEKSNEIEALKKEVQRLTCFLDADGTNSGTPTSKTPLSKKKVIPNSRKKTGKKIGGQPGHPKSKLKAFPEDEVTEVEIHKPKSCPYCGGQVEETGETIAKDELDYDVVVIKRRHQFAVCKCGECKRESHMPVPTKLKEENQYGSNVKALALSLMNIGNVSVNKVRKMIRGLSEEEINPSEGYLIKQQRKAAGELTTFMEELRKRCVRLQTVYWDETVIDISGRRGCLRFYGDEKLALYTAHRHKNKEGLDDDRVLSLLPKETVVMHDHNRINYNKGYSFSNIECNVHLLRDLQKTTDHLQHEWSGKLKKLLEETNAQRNEAIQKGESAFDDGYVRKFFEEFDSIMILAADQNLADSSRYYVQDERTLILRILDYKDNYLAWVVNFDLPFSNNLSERALRGAKSKMKISGQFQSEETAGHYAIVKSYIETCYRNGLNETTALLRLCDGNPYSVSEIFNTEDYNGE